MSDLQELFTQLRAAYLKQGPPSYDERMDHLAKLDKAVKANKAAIVQAISDDFGHRSKYETYLADIFVVRQAIAYARDHLRDWMQPEAREVAWTFAPSTAEVVPQPVGVVGILSPWNYPVQLALSPLVAAIAAGNRVLVKPSEITPRASEILKKLLAEAFPTDQVAVAIGGMEIAKEFSALPFDHLVFTGSTRVGKEIMRAAAENLTPVTLELGGKCPAIVGTDHDIASAALRILAGKAFNAGQTCVAPDYVFVPKGKMDSFIEASKSAVAQMYPTLADNPDYSSIVNDRQYDRLLSLVADAKEKNLRIVELNPKSEDLPRAQRKMAPTLVIDPPEDALVMQEEIFGPVLPIKSYEKLEEVVAYVQAHPSPLALYYFGHRQAEIDLVTLRTAAGGITINDVMVHFAQEDLPFGGIGASGMGRYHAKEGFETFSQKKPIFFQSRMSLSGIRRPPYGKTLDLAVRVLLGK